MKESVEPIGSNVAVTVDAKVTESPGGIIIPDVAGRAPRSGTVFSVGPGVTTEYGWRGRRVAFKPGSGYEVESGGTKFVIIEHDDILCFLN